MSNVYYDGNDGDDSNRVVDRLTPDPLPPPLYDHNNNNNNDNNDNNTNNTQQRLIILHSIIQRSLDRAEIPNRSSERLQRSPSTFTSFDSTPLTVGENTYLNCMQQLMLAQFESLDRKDIMLLHSESFRVQLEEFHMGIQRLLLLSRLEENRSFVPPHSDDRTCPELSENQELDEGLPITSTVTVTAMNESTHVSTCLKNASALVDVIWEECNGRQVLVMDQINDIGAILQSEEMLRNTLMMSKESKNLLNALEETSTLLYQTSEVVQQFLQWEMEENKKVSSNEISEIDKIQPNNSTGDSFVDIMPTTSLLTSENNNDEFSGLQEETPSCSSTIYSVKDIVLLDESPRKTENNVDDHHELCNSVVSSFNKSFNIDPTTEEEYPTMACNVYRSCAPHVIWQLRFHKFEAGVLRFSKTAPDGKHLRWWAVFNARDILYVELDDSESCIGEAKPPLCQNESCCFSVYFKKNSDDVIRRVRLCCTKRSETLAWFFALRRSSHIARSRS